MTQPPATIGSESEAREQALARYHRAFDDIDAARTLQTRAAAPLHPAAAKVIATLNSEWDGLARHRDLPHLDLDNNAAERALRTPVIGRKNFYGSGAAWAADLAARIWTITATAAQNGTEPLHLLAGYLTACAGNGGKPLTGDQLDPFLRWRSCRTNHRHSPRQQTRPVIRAPHPPACQLAAAPRSTLGRRRPLPPAHTFTDYLLMGEVANG